MTAIVEKPAQMRMPRSRPFRSPWVIALTALATVAFAVPVIAVVLGAFRQNDGTWAATSLVSVLSQPITYRALLNSLILTVSSTALGLALAVVFAWLSQRSDAPFRRAITPAMGVLFAVHTCTTRSAGHCSG